MIETADGVFAELCPRLDLLDLPPLFFICFSTFQYFSFSNTPSFAQKKWFNNFFNLLVVFRQRSR